MSKPSPFDFWYAVQNTHLLRVPLNRLETFGSTIVHYHLVSELMDSVNKVRVREGRIEAMKPRIMTPDNYLTTALEGFGEDADNYLEWLRDHQKDLAILQYGFSIRKQNLNEHILSDGLATVAERVKLELDAQDDPLTALVIGVDEPWEVCLIKLMVEVAGRSAPQNLRELQADPDGSRRRIEADFEAADADPTRLGPLNELLQQSGLFEAYQDRFFQLVRRHQQRKG